MMQAPITHSDRNQCVRDVVLPAGDWYDLRTGEWLAGASLARASMDRFQTPMYARSGSIVPMLHESPKDHRIDMACVDMHCFLRDGQSATTQYRADDGETFAYRKGKRSSLCVSARLDGDTAYVDVASESNAWHAMSLRIVLYAPARRLVLNGRPGRLSDFYWKVTGTAIPCLRSEVVSASRGRP